jgi:hypothetical protein
MSNITNISSVISPDVLKTISASAIIKTFGDQLKDKAKEKVISVVRNKAGELEAELEQLIIDEQQAGVDHNNELKRLETIYKQNQITEKQYNEAVEKENEAFRLQKESFQLKKTKIKNDIKNIVSDPYNKIKEDRKKRKAQRQEKQSKNKARDAEAKRDANKKVIKNAAKSLPPIIALQIANQLSAIISQRSKLEELVDQVNAYIDTANTPETTTIATNLRNNTIALINNSISKLQKLQTTLNQINIYLTIFGALIPLLNRVAPLTVISTPPLTPIPGMIPHDELRNKKQNLEKLVSALNAVLAIAVILLENEVNKLNELILRLKNINLDGLNSQQLSDLTSSIYNNVDEFPPYKGFKFKIKEEQNQAFVVKGNKRRYAVATDRDGVEVLKSDFSFTLDPNDLVDQLKLVIDQRNLQG